MAIDLKRVPTSALWKELERRASAEYQRRVSREYRLGREWRERKAADKTGTEPA